MYLYLIYVGNILDKMFYHLERGEDALTTSKLAMYVYADVYVSVSIYVGNETRRKYEKCKCIPSMNIS